MAYENGSARTTIRSGLDLVLTWSKTGTSDLSSLINVKLDLVATQGSYTINAPGSPADAQIIVNGTKYETKSINLSSTYGKNLMNINVTLPHGTDGKQTLRLYASLYSPVGIYLGGSRWSYSTIGTVNWELPALFSPSSFSLTNSQYTLGSGIGVRINRGGSNHKLYFYAMISGTVIDTWTFNAGNALPTSLGASSRQLSEAPKILTTTDRGMVTLSMATYIGDQLITTQTETILGVLPASYKPTMTNLIIAPVNPSSIPVADRGRYIRTFTQVSVQLVATKSDDNVYFGHTENQKNWYEVQVDGTTYYGNKILSNNIQKTSITVRGRLRDTRGRWSDWMSETISADDYTAPTLAETSAQRYSSGPDTTTGITDPAGANLGIYSIIKGTPPMKILVESENLTTGAETPRLSDNSSAGSYTLNKVFAGLPTADEHIVYLWVTDKYGQTVHWQKKIPTSQYAFTIGKDNIGVNKIPKRKGMEIEGDIWQELGDIYQDGDRLLDIKGNSDGYYAKFSSGLLICWKENLAIGAPTIAMNQIYRSASTQWTFAHPFAIIPSVSAHVRSGRAYGWIGMGDTVTSATSASFVLMYPYNNTTTSTISVMAIGAWKK